MRRIDGSTTRSFKMAGLARAAPESLEEIGESGAIRKISDKVASDLQPSDSIREIPYKEGSTRIAFDSNAGWARSYLKIAGLIENSSRGDWTINEYERSVQSDKKVREIVDEASKEYLKCRSLKKSEDGSSERFRIRCKTNKIGKITFSMYCAVFCPRRSSVFASACCGRRVSRTLRSREVPATAA